MSKHRLVCIGDSLTQGFKSGAIYEPQLSFPALIAWEMGIPDDDFRFAPFAGKGGLPINVEYLLRKMDAAFGKDVNWWEIPVAGYYLRDWMDEVEDYWERGHGAGPIGYRGPYHNLAVWGFQIQDAYQVTAEMCEKSIASPSDDWLNQVPERAMLRTALRILNPHHSKVAADKKATQISRTEQLAKDGGIENLIVFLGANHVLGSVIDLEYRQSTDAELNEPNPINRKSNVYLPEHFEQVIGTLMAKIDGIDNVERVFWGSVPPVTVPPVTNGVDGRMDTGMGLPSPYDNDHPDWFRRYFRHYTRPWIPEANFTPFDDPSLTGEEAMRIDWTIAQYKKILIAKIDEHNAKQTAAQKEPNWFLVDFHWLLDRVAARRYSDGASVPPPGWTPYELPDRYQELGLNSRFLRSKEGKRVQGGLFSLDGIHPTTAGYGIVAQEVINVMQASGVKFLFGDGKTERVTPITVDWERILHLDSLVNTLPATLDDIWDKLVDGDQVADLFKRALRAVTFRG